MSDYDLKRWCSYLIAGSVMLMVAFFVPWWSLTATKTRLPSRRFSNRASTKYEQYQKELKSYNEREQEAGKVLKKKTKWYRDSIPDSVRVQFEEDTKEARKEAFKDAGGDDRVTYSSTMRLWGWHTGIGLTNFIFSFFILAIALVAVFVRVLRSWIWIGFFVAAILGLVGFILSLVWYFSSPGENVSELLSQGVGLSPGPYLNIFGTLAVLCFGALGGVLGLRHFVEEIKEGQQETDRKRRRKRKRKRKRTTPPEGATDPSYIDWQPADGDEQWLDGE